MKLKKQKQKETKLVILAIGRGTRLAELTGVVQTFKFEEPQSSASCS